MQYVGRTGCRKFPVCLEFLHSLFVWSHVFRIRMAFYSIAPWFVFLAVALFQGFLFLEGSDWMHNKTDPKGLWVCNFDQEEDTSDDAQLLAEYVGNELEPNVPYFVAPYDGANGTDMRSKTFVFSGHNVTVKPNPSAITSGTYHMVVGDFVQKGIENAYFLNAAGSHFVKAAQGTVKAFEAYADNVTANSNATQLQIVLDENAEDAPSYVRGDVDRDGRISISDVTTLVDYLLNPESTDIDTMAADCHIDGEVNLTDVTILIDFLLLGTW